MCRLGAVNDVLPPISTASDPAVPTDFAVGSTERSDSVGVLVWSGGMVPAGVTSVTYRFPDGHRESAIVKDGFWVMEYTSDTPLEQLAGRRADLPIRVTLTGSGGRKQLTVTWEDFCFRGSRGMSVAMGC